MQTSEKKTDARTQWVDRLQNSNRLRVIVAASMLALGYVAIYWPLATHLAETKRQLAQEEKRRDLIRDIEQLRGEVNNFKDRLPAKTDTNEWVQYVLDGLRGFPLRVTTLDPAEPQRVGPYNVVVLQIELEGAFHDLDAFVNWLETNERLFRVDEVKISHARHGSDALQVQLKVLGVMG
jgi:Tfp pilus assembly protein PilO